MRTAPTVAGVFGIAALVAAPAFAQRGHQPTTPHAAAPTTHTTTATHGSPHAAPTQTTTSTHGNGHAATPTHTTSTTAHGNGHGTTRRPTATTRTSATTSAQTTNPIATRISRNPRLANRLTRMLPDGMTLATASNGFRNRGQFIAALHVSQNLGIPFADLKAAMTGETPVSLGQAIHTLRPSADADDAVHRANRQTQADLR
jgi:hypothetical protein